jgi:hypothetical protein
MDSEPKPSAEGTGGESAPPDRDFGKNPDVDQAVNAFSTHFDNLSRETFHYIQARFDLVRLGVYQWLVRISLALIAVLAAAGLIVTAIVLACVGMAEALSALFGRAWLGDLVTGIILLAGIIGLCYFGFTMYIRSLEKEFRERCETRQQHRDLKSNQGGNGSDRNGLSS